jgi:hypothetical protein
MHQRGFAAVECAGCMFESRITSADRTHFLKVPRRTDRYRALFGFFRACALAASISPL